MQRVKGRGVHFAGHEKMPQIGAGEGPAGVAAADWIRRAVVLGIARIPDVEPTFAGEELTVPRVARRQHAIEQIDAARDRLDEVLWRAGPHQIARPVCRKVRRGVGHEVIHYICRLADAQPADGIGFESDRDGFASALPT
jgi:hypothetical protein